MGRFYHYYGVPGARLCLERNARMQRSWLVTILAPFLLNSQFDYLDLLESCVIYKDRGQRKKQWAKYAEKAIQGWEQCGLFVRYSLYLITFAG